MQLADTFCEASMELLLSQYYFISTFIEAEHACHGIGPIERRLRNQHWRCTTHRRDSIAIA
jgi:hypothetical protein